MSFLVRAGLLCVCLTVNLLALSIVYGDDAPPAAEPAATDEAEEAAEVEVLGVGDPAPPISIDQWVTGEAVGELKPGQIYVVEFWATWCGPCLASMPHIAQMQTEYGDEVQFIGVTSEDLETVTGFLEEEQSAGKLWSEVITYRLAIDADNATNTAYMDAAQEGGIPTAFIVGREGILEWIGHPATMDNALASIVAGTWDREKYIRVQETFVQLNQLYGEGLYDDALALLDTIEADMDDPAQAARVRLVLLQAAGRTEEAAALQAQMVEDAWDDASALNEIAWSIATGGGDQDLDLALRAGERAVELTNNEDANIIDTLARVHFALGDLDKAIELETQAVEIEPGFQTTLDFYREIQAASEEAEAEKEENP